MFVELKVKFFSAIKVVNDRLPRQFTSTRLKFELLEIGRQILRFKVSTVAEYC